MFKPASNKQSTVWTLSQELHQFLCTFVLKETLAYKVKNQTTAFCTFLDASKAFDRINYCKLFRLLINRGMPAFVTRVILNLYIGNFVRISWCGILSDYFLATSGVK